MEYKKNDTIQFGNYWQDKSVELGKKPIEWIILDVKKDRLLLLSKYVIDNQVFSIKEKEGENSEVTWENSSIRKWLNNVETLDNSFINNAFNESEQKRIIDTDIYSEQNKVFCTDFGMKTSDKVFLLSIDDIYARYFFNDAERIAKPTDYVKANNVVCNSTVFFENVNVGVFWWVRNRGYDGRHVAYVMHNGKVAFCGSRSYNSSIFVRPAIWLKV